MAVTGMTFQFPGLARVHCLFQMRALPENASFADPCDGGNIAFNVPDAAARVRENRQALLALAAGQGALQWAEVNQVHGDTLLFEPDAVDCAASPLVEADGQATARRGLALLIRTADCQPILLAHSSGQYIMALHVGWRGNRCAFPRTAVQRFCRQYGIEPRDVLAVRGPSLGPARAVFSDFAAEWGTEFSPWYDEHTRCMNLWALTRHQLHEAGIPHSQIYGLDLCTAANDALFFSYRRNRNTGRQAALIWMEA